MPRTGGARPRAGRPTDRSRSVGRTFSRLHAPVPRSVDLRTGPFAHRGGRDRWDRNGAGRRVRVSIPSCATRRASTLVAAPRPADMGARPILARSLLGSILVRPVALWPALLPRPRGLALVIAAMSNWGGAL